MGFCILRNDELQGGKNMKIFLNPGHGGTDPGAVSKTGTKEAEITKEICQILADRLKLNGYNFCVFQQKQSFFEIVKEENKSGATLFISVHCNSFKDVSANGVETLYYSTSKKGKQIAGIMQNEIVKATCLRNRGIKTNDGLYVLKHTKAPAILIECAFISNPTEEALLKNNPKLFADAIFEGIKKIKNIL